MKTPSTGAVWPDGCASIVSPFQRDIGMHGTADGTCFGATMEAAGARLGVDHPDTRNPMKIRARMRAGFDVCTALCVNTP